MITKHNLEKNNGLFLDYFVFYRKTTASKNERKKKKKVD